MTYTERIERVKHALRENARDREAGYILTEDFADYLARAADRAVLEAIREPTEEMVQEGGDQTLIGDADDIKDIWHVMHAAIPRGEEGG